VTNAISIGSLAYNWFIGTVLCYWWWGKALSVLPAARLGQIVTLIPVLAVLMSAAVYGEHIGITVIASMVLIIIGIMITLHSKNVARPSDLDSAA
jgi:drug/metabolite transporter (DMT)-like permease